MSSRIVLPGMVPRVAALILLISGAAAGLPPAAADPRAEDLKLAVVLAHISENHYASVEAFSAMVREIVDSAVSSGAELVVFPEYLNVFLAALPYREQISRSDTLAGALRRIRAVRRIPAGLHELLIEQAPAVRAIMDRLYGSLARKHRIHILAGTYFAAENISPAADREPRTRLTNRSVLYGPLGAAVHEQDKVYLTDFESGLLGLDPGSLSAVEGVRIDGFDIGITICRDVFFSVWEHVHEERDLWIDLRAEGTQWVQGREDFTEILPERIARSDTDYGATVSLTGAFLDLFWQGRSSIICRCRDGVPNTLATTHSYADQEIITVTLR